jgi:hypothetical protein
VGQGVAILAIVEHRDRLRLRDDAPVPQVPSPDGEALVVGRSDGGVDMDVEFIDRNEAVDAVDAAYPAKASLDSPARIGGTGR